MSIRDASLLLRERLGLPKQWSVESSAGESLLSWGSRRGGFDRLTLVLQPGGRAASVASDYEGERFQAGWRRLSRDRGWLLHRRWRHQDPFVVACGWRHWERPGTPPRGVWVITPWGELLLRRAPDQDSYRASLRLRRVAPVRLSPAPLSIAAAAGGWTGPVTLWAVVLPRRVLELLKGARPLRGAKPVLLFPPFPGRLAGPVALTAGLLQAVTSLRIPVRGVVGAMRLGAELFNGYR